MIKGIVFDLDGILVDAVPFHNLAFTTALKTVTGNNYELQAFLKKTEGCTTIQRLVSLEIDDSLHQRINDLKQSIMVRYIDSYCEPIDRVIEVVSYARDNFKIAVATNCSEPAALLMLQKSKLIKYFDLKSIVTNAQVDGKYKPHPASYSRAADSIKVNRHECLAIDDSGHGVIAAIDARLHIWHLRKFENLTVENLKKRIRCPQGRKYAL